MSRKAVPNEGLSTLDVSGLSAIYAEYAKPLLDEEFAVDIQE